MSTLSQKRIQDPVLTQLAYGYYNNELVCETLFPIVEIEKEGGKIPQFGRLAFRQQSTVRQVHGDSNRLTPEDVTAISIELEEHDIEYPIDYREDHEASYPLKQHALSVVQEIIALGREMEAAKLAQDESNYNEQNKFILSGDSKFSNLKLNPLPIFDGAINAVISNTGRRPNVCVIAQDVWLKLKENTVLLDRIKYTRAGILTPQVFAELIDVKTVKIGAAMKEESGQLKPIWSDCVILAYVPTKGENNSIYAPSYGYTIRRKEGLFVDTYTEKGGKVEIVRCTDIHKPCIMGKSAGVLLKKCINQ
ncbi:inorganic pyrophosphatase [Pasteurellaceae bacterium HPA106]|uniref:inorganic pyrophosphatase n=1 Tax=Spirabiliibacterium pneumoniae TaxID=221400 RepID=UPI001AAD925B|nr:inorganic pyrophosphatase [Spirabiliibacterium pneumoniae]MBE2896585.1 inorganic pyrophosphatase [Spirabiliibacterium pneumoniae]